MLEVAAAKEVVVKKPPITFDYKAGEDSYMRVINVMDGTGHVVGKITSAPGHCCAAAILGTLSAYGFWTKKETVNAFVGEMKKHWRQERQFRPANSSTNLSLFNISGFHVYLSPETRGFDQALREHPDIKLVHSFINKRTSGGGWPYQGNQIDLYYMEF